MLTFTDEDIVDYYLHKNGVAIVTVTNSFTHQQLATTILTKQELQQLIKYIEDGEDE